MADPRRFEEHTPSVLAPQKSLPKVRTEIPGLAAKGTLVPKLQKALTLERMKARYPKSTWTHVFTDSSADNSVRHGGSGVYIYCPNGTIFSLSIPAGDLSSNYLAEVHALKAATECLIEEDCSQQNIVLLSDSLYAFQSLMNGLTDLSTQAATQQPVCSVNQQQGSAPVGASTFWRRQQQISHNPMSPPLSKKTRQFWNRSRNQGRRWCQQSIFLQLHGRWCVCEMSERKGCVQCDWRW